MKKRIILLILTFLLVAQFAFLGHNISKAQLFQKTQIKDLSLYDDPEFFMDKSENLFSKIWGGFSDFLFRIKERLLAQIAPPTNLVNFNVIGRLTLPNGNASAIETYKDYLYLVLNETSKSPLVFNISQPDKPRLVNMLPAQGWPTRIRMVEGTNWLWAVHGNTWAFYDVTDPSNPRLAGPNEGPNVKFIKRGPDNPPYSFAQHPNLTYSSVANANTLFYGREDSVNQVLTTEIYDISDPSKPKLLSKLDNASPRVLRGNILIASSFDKIQVGPKSQAFLQVKVFDVTNPASPKLLTTIKTPRSLTYQLFGFNDAFDYDPEGKKLYIATGRVKIKLFGLETFDPRLGRTSSGIAVYDVSDWSNPKFLGHAAFPDYNNANYISNVDWIVFNKGFIYGSDMYYGLRVYDVRDPQNIKYVYGYKVGGEVSGIALVPSRNLVLLNQNLQGGLIFVDVSDPSNPKYLNDIPHGFANWGNNFVLNDRYLIFGAGRRYIASGLFVVDFQDVSNPKFKLFTKSTGCYLTDKNICYSSGHISASSFDFSTDPMNPTDLGSVFSNVLPRTVRTNNYLIDNTYLNVIAYEKPLLFVLADIKDINDTGKLLGHVLYLFNTESGDAKKPQLVGKLEILSGPVHRVVTSAIIKDKLYISWWGKIVGVDFSNPSSPKLIGEWSPAALSLPSHYTHVWTDGNILFVGSYRNSLAAYDVNTSDGSPRLIGKIDGVCTSWLMTGDPHQKMIYRTCLDGLQIIKYDYSALPEPQIQSISTNTPPSVYIYSPVNNQSFETDGTSTKVVFQFRFIDKDNDKVKYSLNIKNNAGENIFGETSDLLNSGTLVTKEVVLPIGDYTWQLNASDENGNSSPVFSYKISIDKKPEAIQQNRPPEISVAAPGKITILNTSTLQAYIGLNDPERDPVKLKFEFVDASTTALVFASTTDFINTPAHKWFSFTLNPGKYRLRVYATDSFGNTIKFPHFEPYIEVPEVVLVNNAPLPPKIKLVTPTKKEQMTIDNKVRDVTCIETKTPTFQIEGSDPDNDDLTYKLIIRDNQYPWDQIRDVEIPIPGKYKSGESFQFTLPQDFALHRVQWGYRVWVVSNDGKLPSLQTELGGVSYLNICTKASNNKPNPPEIIFPPDDFVFRRFIPTATTVLRDNLVFQIKGTDPDPEDTLRFEVEVTNQETGNKIFRGRIDAYGPGPDGTTRGWSKRYYRGWNKNWYKQGEVAELDSERGEVFMEPGRYEVKVYAHDGFNWSEPTTIHLTVF